MTYNQKADIFSDSDIRRRLTAAAAEQDQFNPAGWVDANMWVFAVQPDWDNAYGYAKTAGNEHPGADEAVITDAMILAAVQYVQSNPATP